MITCKSWLLFIASYIYIYIICLFSLLAHRSNIGVLDLRVANRAGKAVSVCVCVALHKAVGNLFVTEVFGSSSLENKYIYIYIYIIIYSASGPRLSVSIDSNRSKLLDSGVGAGSGLFSCHQCGWFGMGENLLSHSVRGVLVHIWVQVAYFLPSDEQPSGVNWKHPHFGSSTGWKSSCCNRLPEKTWCKCSAVAQEILWCKVPVWCCGMECCWFF